MNRRPYCEHEGKGHKGKLSPVRVNDMMANMTNSSHNSGTFAVDVPPHRKIIFDMASNGWDGVGWGNIAHSVTELLCISFALRLGPCNTLNSLSTHRLKCL